MREQHIEYRDGDTLLEGFLCYDETLPGPRPAVLINHTWAGRDEFVERKARRLADTATRATRKAFLPNSALAS